MPRFFLLACLPLLAASCLPREASAQVRRCEAADGRTVYTDKQCRDIGAVERVQRNASAGTGQASLHRRQCSRTLQDLTFELTMAIDDRDPNRLAGIYHWPGMPTRSAYTIMARLDAIANRPLIDVRPLYPEEPERAAPVATAAPDPAAPPPSSEILRSRTPWRPPPTAQAPSPDATVSTDTPVEQAPSPRKRRAPHSLQVEQTLANGSTPSRTVFGLRRHMGCWWISL